MTNTFAVVTGGGTAGHVLPALAVAEALEARGYDPSELHYVGCQRGIETRLVPQTEYPHAFFDVIGFQRSLDRRNMQFAPKMWRAYRRAVGHLQDLRPQVVVTVGGYASMPSVLAARRLGIPIVVVSYDRLPGKATQLTARFASSIAVAFERTPLEGAIMTGAPVRAAILDVDRERDRASARDQLGVPADRFMLAVMGGSQGSGALNQFVSSYLDQHRGDASLAIRHAVGERFIDAARPSIDGADGVLYQPVGYEDDMPAVYAAADLLVGRGGASTVHEVAATGTPSILVPWSNAAEDHQRHNVEWLADDGAAIVIEEKAIDDVGPTIDDLRRDQSRRAELSAAASAKGRVHRSGALAKLIIEAATNSRR